MSFLLAVSGRAAGVRYTLEAETTLGRSSSAGIQLLEPEVSRLHARIVCASGGAHIEDLSEAGTRVNGLRVGAQGQRLSAGDAITIGSSTFLYNPRLDYVPAGAGPDLIIAEEPPLAASELPVAGDETTAAAEAGAIYEILARALAPGQEDGGALARALGVVARRFGAERALLLEAAEEGRPRVLASVGSGPITVSRTVVDRVLRERRAVVSGDAARDLAFQGGVSLQSAEIRSLLAAPLCFEARVIGLLHLDRRAKDAYGPAELAALVPLANALAVVCLAVRGVEDLARRARRVHRVERPEVVAESPAMQRVVADVKKAAAAASTVLLTGETGSGKEILARLLHAEGPRARGPFVAVNCAALPSALAEAELFGHVRGAFTGAEQDRAGLFEAAGGGTLFLDEIGECTKEIQVKLLRALQERVIFRVGSARPLPVDVRVVAASSRRLEQQVAEGRFREDLFFRLAVVHLRVPSLADRPEDVLPLARRFVLRACARAGLPARRLAPDAEALLAQASFPGNVRELENVLERAVILSEGPAITSADLPGDLLLAQDLARRATQRAETLAAAVEALEREMITRALARTGGVKSAVADALGISRVTLDAKLKALEITWEGRKKRSG